MKRKIKVSSHYYRSEHATQLDNGIWIPATPTLYGANPIEVVLHFLGLHWTYGQPYCVVCGREEFKTN